MIQRHHGWGTFVFCLLLLTGEKVAAADSPRTFTTLLDSVKNTDIGLDFRYRLEDVDQDNNLKNALASTLKSRLTLKLPPVSGWGATIEIDDVSHPFSDEFDSTRNREDRYSRVADPEGTDMNLLFLNRIRGASTIAAGRQRLMQGDSRFLSGVAFRQNEQTFDALTYKRDGGADGLSIEYNFAWRVLRIFGGDGPNLGPTDEFEGDAHFLHVKKGSWSAWAHALDFDGDGKGVSIATFGGQMAPKFGKLELDLTAAYQRDHGNNPNNFKATYYRVIAAYPLAGNIKAKLGYEVLGSDDGKAAFATPLAALHKFQGNADIFVATGSPTMLPLGIRDTNIGLMGKVGPFEVKASLHDFSSDEGNADYGREIDAGISFAFRESISGELKFAKYMADDMGVDTQKAWLTLRWKVF